MSEPEGGRLSAWSRRKLEAKREEKAAGQTPEAPFAKDAPEADAPEPIDGEMIAALPSLDEIKAGFDMAPFLAKGVPTHLKNAALRKLWQASPAVRDYVDPAVDYAWDWNAPGGVPGGGGVLSEESIVKMVKDIIGAKSDDAQKAVVADDPLADPDQPIQPDQPEVPDDADAPDSEPVSVRMADRQRPATEPPGVEDSLRKSDQSAVAPKRRHGSATPE